MIKIIKTAGFHKCFGCGSEERVAILSIGHKNVFEVPICQKCSVELRDKLDEMFSKEEKSGIH